MAKNEENSSGKFWMPLFKCIDEKVDLILAHSVQSNEGISI